jgi:cytochrome c oxidase cbb3-type subunit 3
MSNTRWTGVDCLRPLTRVGFVVVMAFALAGQPARGQDHTEQYAPTDVAAGARVYNALCASCHGPTGAGVGGIDLRRGSLPRATTDTALRAIVTNGFPASGMPASTLSADDLRALVAFVRAGLDASPNAASVGPGDAVRGRLLFETEGRCLDCHRVGDAGGYSGPDLTEIGRTSTAPAIRRSLLDPTGSMRPINRPVRAVARDGHVIKGRRLNEDTYTVQLRDDDGRLVSLVKSDLREWTVFTTSPMPSYGERLTPVALADVVAYLVSLNGSRP